MSKLSESHKHEAQLMAGSDHDATMYVWRKSMDAVLSELDATRKERNESTRLARLNTMERLFVPCDVCDSEIIIDDCDFVPELRHLAESVGSQSTLTDKETPAIKE